MAKGWKMTPEARLKISIARKKFYANGGKNPMQGVHLPGPMKGKHHTEATKLKLSLAHKGKKLSEEHKRKVSEAMKKSVKFQTVMKSSEYSKKLSDALKGHKHSNETKIKIGLKGLGRVMPSGEKHCNWLGGKSYEPYSPDFNSKLKRKIRERDNYTCQKCGRSEQEEIDELDRVLAVNHIDFDKKNSNPNNLNALCLRCNVGINGERVFWEMFFKIHNMRKIQFNNIFK